MCLILLVSSTWYGVGLGVIIATTFIILLSCSKEEAVSNLKYEYKKANLTDKEKLFIGLLNDYRKDNGLSILKVDEISSNEALKHNVYMISIGEASHEGFPERSQYLRQLGAKNVSEIVGYGFVGCETAFKAFCNSEAHKKAIIGDFDLVGISIIENYYTLIFIKI